MIKKTLLFDKIKLPFRNNCEANRPRRHKSSKILKNRCDLKQESERNNIPKSQNTPFIWVVFKKLGRKK
ncbi:hypothetical protein AK966_09410 [Vibrio sp. PID23_8]|nr:hypothetical protein AK965_06150 [Vibrio sp. PID17_43]RIZ54624.1 hypothetical protein AK966_09410 [Vibrio sp. PID23_8]